MNHQQSIQLQAQKQLLAEKHKELFNLDSQIDQLSEELKHKKSQNRVNLNALHSGSDDFYDNDNSIWENGESFDWSEFTNAEDRYDEEVYANYNDSDANEHHGKSRQSGTRHLETLLEVDETSSVAFSKTSADSNSIVSSNESPISPNSGCSSRVSKLASIFEAEVADQKAKDHKPVSSGHESHYFNGISRERHELQNLRMQQSSLDSGFSSRTVGSSPLSSPSSLSSLSSLSSSSSASKSLPKPDDFQNTNSAENALRGRAMKTEGMDTYAVPTYQEKPRTLYEARVHGDSRNEFQISRKHEIPELMSNSSLMSGFESSSQKSNATGVDLKEQVETMIPNTSRDVKFYPTDGPSTKSRTVTTMDEPSEASTLKQDYLKKPIKPTYKTSSVSLVLSSPPVRDILSESVKTQEESGKTIMGLNTITSSDHENLSVSSSEGDDYENFKMSCSAPTESRTSIPQPAITKVKISLLSTGTPSKVVNRDAFLDESEEGNVTPPRSPQSNTASRYFKNRELLNDPTNRDITPPRSPQYDTKSLKNDEFLRSQNNRDLTPPRSPQNRISRMHKRDEQFNEQDTTISRTAANGHTQTFKNKDESGTRNEMPPRHLLSHDPNFRSKEDLAKRSHPFFQNKEEILKDYHQKRSLTPPRSPLTNQHQDGQLRADERKTPPLHSSSAQTFPEKNVALGGHVKSGTTPPRSPQSPGTAPAFPGRNDSQFTQERGNTTPPRSPNISKFESWDVVRSQGKRTAKVQPVDSFNAKKVPVSFSPNANKHLKSQKDDPMVYKQTSNDKKVGGGNRHDTPLTTEKKKSRHVSLDPHAVLLDAAVEGELEQVKLAIRDVSTL